jgi:hypothetical protein
MKTFKSRRLRLYLSVVVGIGVFIYGIGFIYCNVTSDENCLLCTSFVNNFFTQTNATLLMAFVSLISIKAFEESITESSKPDMHIYFDANAQNRKGDVHFSFIHVDSQDDYEIYNQWVEKTLNNSMSIIVHNVGRSNAKRVCISMELSRPIVINDYTPIQGFFHKDGQIGFKHDYRERKVTSIFYISGESIHLEDYLLVDEDNILKLPLERFLLDNVKLEIIKAWSKNVLPDCRQALKLETVINLSVNYFDNFGIKREQKFRISCKFLNNSKEYLNGNIQFDCIEVL